MRAGTGLVRLRPTREPPTTPPPGITLRLHDLPAQRRHLNGVTRGSTRAGTVHWSATRRRATASCSSTSACIRRPVGATMTEESPPKDELLLTAARGRIARGERPVPEGSSWAGPPTEPSTASPPTATASTATRSAPGWPPAICKCPRARRPRADHQGRLAPAQRVYRDRQSFYSALHRRIRRRSPTESTQQ